MKKGKRLVVDASVARSAGQTEHPVSKACREAMEAILFICHRLVMTDGIYGEWKKHESLFSCRWRAAMVARKKRVFLRAEDLDDSIAERISSAKLIEAHRQALMDDLCLIQAAFAADRIIITRDDRLRAILHEYPKLRTLAKQITWINPEREKLDRIPNLRS